MAELILGGMRSGKSREAQRRAASSGLEVVYIATATAQDEEMRRRIARHRAQRPAGWTTVEQPLRLADTLQAWGRPSRCLVVDCLTLWLSNWLLPEGEPLAGFTAARHELLQAVTGVPGRLILVSNETNQGVVPVNALARRFCDEAGWLHQDIAALCDRVTLMVAGLPMDIRKENDDTSVD